MFTIPIPSRVKHEDNQSFCYVNFGYSPDCKSSPKSCPRRAQRISCDCWKAISPPTSYVNLNVSFVFKNRWELCGCHFSRRGTETKKESLEVRIRAARVSLLPLLSCEACCPTTIDRRWLRLLWEGLSLVKSRVNVTLIVTGFTQCFTAAVSITIRFLLLPQRRLFPPLFLW